MKLSAKFLSMMAVSASLGWATQASAMPILQQVGPHPTDYIFGVGPGGDFTQGAGPIMDVTAPLYAVDLWLPSPPLPGSTSGCEASDFAGFAVGSIALIQRGTCNFELKMQNAAAAGAIGILFFNDGLPGRTDPISFALSTVAPVPTFFASFSVGTDLVGLLSSGPVTLRMRTEESVFTAPGPGAGGIPEPATWAMMIMGFGLAGMAMRRRSTSKLAPG